MINVSDAIKDAYQKSTVQIDKIVINNTSYRISNVQYYDDCYNEGNIFGTAIARALEFEIENTIDLEKKEFEYFTGVVINGVTHWICLGNFITQDTEPNDTTNIAKITAMDYMLKTNIKYESKLNYSSGKVTLLQVLQEACNNAGLILATTEFANKDFIVDSNQFAEGTLIRQVIQAIAQLSGTFAKIKSDNRLYFITPKKDTIKVKDVHEMTVQELNELPIGTSFSNNKYNLGDYEKLELKRQTHPINAVSLGLSDIEGENITLRDEQNVSKNGENILVFNDNPFAYTQQKREQLITALFNTVLGFEYVSYEIKGQSKPYMETGDEIIVIDKNGNRKESFLFRFNYKSPNGLESEMSAPSIIKATVAYQNVPSALDIAKRTEIIVDKQNQTITEIIQKTDKNEEKIVSIERDIDGINADVKSTKEEMKEDLKTTREDLETQIQLSAEGVESNVSKIYSTKEETTQAKQDAISSANTSTDNKLKNYSTTTQMNSAISQKADEIKTSVSETYITKEDSSTNINKAKTDAINSANAETDNKLKKYSTTTEINSAITQKANEITSTVKETYITKEDSESNISQAKTEAIDSANNNTANKLKDYSTTKQMNSAIEQKANSIVSSVSENYITKEDSKTNIESAKSEAINSANTNTTNKLKDYSTTTQMNSAITQKANEINSTVSATYETKTNVDKKISSAKTEIKQTTDSITAEVNKKVDNDDFGTKIEQNYESVKIAWNTISEFIQFVSAQLQIKDNNKSLLMVLDKLGQHFYSNSKVFAEMGVKEVDNNNYIAFSVPSDYNKTIADGMAWGITTTSDNKFFPILFINNFRMGNKNADNYGGELVLNMCDLVLGGMNAGITTGEIKMRGDIGSLIFEDVNTGEILFRISLGNIVEDDNIAIFNKISFFKNQLGSNSLRLGSAYGNNVTLTDNGEIHTEGGSTILGSADKPIIFSAYVNTTGDFHGNFNVLGNIYANNFSSDKRIKKNIKNSEESALEIIKQIKHRQFDMKEDGKHYNVGYIAQEMENIDKNFVLKREKTDEIEERYYINELPILATATKAIQELQQEIETLKQEIKELKEVK